MRGNPYETRRYLEEYLLFHYGPASELCPFAFVPRALLTFHTRVRKECLLPLAWPGPTRGLDIGCAVGRFTFELGRIVDHALGIDNSTRFIQAARRMVKSPALAIRVKEAGARFRSVVLTLPKALRQGKVEFRVGDAMNLAASVSGRFQVVAALNLLCRLPDPRRFLSQLHRLVVPRGQLILASPFSWLPEQTPRRQWLTSEQIEARLHPHFRLVRRRDLPFVLREHRRKYQLVVSEVSVFVRRPL